MMVGPAYVVVMGRCDWQVKGHSIRLLIITAIWGSRETVLGELKTVLSSSVHVNPMRSPWNTGNTGLVDAICKMHGGSFDKLKCALTLGIGNC